VFLIKKLIAKQTMPHQAPQIKQNQKPPHTILVLEKAMNLLSRFDSSRAEWGVTELSKDLDINKSTVSKILSTLENHRYLVKNAENRKYKLGLRLFELGSLVASQLDLQKEALVYMEELNKKVGETVHLVVMDDFDIIYINKVESAQSLRIGTRVGGRLPAHCTGVGKVLLAALSPEELNIFLKKRPLKRFTPSTITDPEDLRKALAQIRAQGYALDNEEFNGGLMCAAAPIKNYSQKIIGAISISGPTNRIREKNLENLISMVKSIAQKISQRLGCNDGNSEKRATL
jgi:DNA-binding IclR family transcriptional regulator